MVTIIDKIYWTLIEWESIFKYFHFEIMLGYENLKLIVRGFLNFK